MKQTTSKLIFTLLGALVLLFIIAPLVSMVINTPGSVLYDTVKDVEVLQSMKLTLAVSLVTTLFFALGAIPLAYILARNNFPLKGFVKGLIDLPIVIPHSAAGIAVLGFISRDSVLGGVASSFGLNFVGHPIGIGLAMAFVSVPFLINASRDGFLSGHCHDVCSWYERVWCSYYCCISPYDNAYFNI